jgi:hypothetical protein
MKITEERHGEVVVLTYRDAAGEGSPDVFREVDAQLEAGVRKLVVDARQMPKFSAAEIGRVIKSREQVRGREGQIERIRKTWEPGKPGRPPVCPPAGVPRSLI